MIHPAWNASNEATPKNCKKTLPEPTCHYQFSNFQHSCNDSFKIVTMKKKFISVQSIEVLG